MMQSMALIHHFQEGEIKDIEVDGKQLQLETVNLKPLVFGNLFVILKTRP